LSSGERLLQVDELLSGEWLAHGGDDEPLLLCGDFNMLPRSAAYRRVCDRLRDAQVAADGRRPAATWSSAYPLGRVDHVFISSHFDVVTVEVRRTQLARVASDHLPLLVELRLQASVVDTTTTDNLEIPGV
jgi:endonuclease/exonuclease/phosphatase family metal-dependent hydrolase